MLIRNILVNNNNNRPRKQVANTVGPIKCAPTMVLIMTNKLNGIVYIRPLFVFYVHIINKLLTYLKHRFQSIIIISIVSAISRVVCVVLTAALCRTIGGYRRGSSTTDTVSDNYLPRASAVSIAN